MQELWVRSLGQEDPLEKEMATHSSIPAWEIPWTEEPGGIQSMRSQSRLSDETTITTNFAKRPTAEKWWNWRRSRDWPSVSLHLTHKLDVLLYLTHKSNTSPLGLIRSYLSVWLDPSPLLHMDHLCRRWSPLQRDWQSAFPTSSWATRMEQVQRGHRAAWVWAPPVPTADWVVTVSYRYFLHPECLSATSLLVKNIDILKSTLMISRQLTLTNPQTPTNSQNQLVLLMGFPGLQHHFTQCWLLSR